jgi:galactokinase
MSDIISLHRREYGTIPEVVVSAPGIVTLLGDQSDFNEGYILQFGLNRRVEVAVSKRKDSSLRFFAADFEERKRSTIANLKYKREDRWANYPKGVLGEILEQGHRLKKGLNFTISGQIPQEIGLGASTALCTATIYALRKLLRLSLGDKECVELALGAEAVFIGSETSISNFMTSALCKKGRAMYIDVRELEYEHIPFKQEDVVILLTIANIPKVSAENEIQIRKNECRKCVEFLRKTGGGQSLRDFSVDDLKQSTGIVPENTRRLCMHVLEENSRVLEGKEALGRNDFPALGRLLNKSHESLRDNYEVSCPEIDWLVKRAWELEEVLGSRLTGSGFGTCTVSLVRKEGLDAYFERLEEYERIFGFNAETIVCKPDSGISFVDVTEKE